VTPSRRYAHRRVSLTIAMLLVSFTTILSYMGLPEFAVSTSAETEIIHELTFEPAHSHVGVMRTIPYDQLVPGLYTTAQIGVPEEELNAFLAEFNEQVAASGELDMMNAQLTVDHVATSLLPTAFRLVPDDAPVLEEVLVDFQHLLERDHLELANAWGAILVTENQSGLRRLDVIISWDGVEIENGLVVMENGEPKPLYERDANGEVVVGADGQPVRVHRIQTKHLFLHQDSAYFD